MACSCKQKTNGSIPAQTRPDETCLSCARKHLDSALAWFKYSTSDPLLIAGQLGLAWLHCRGIESDVVTRIREMQERFLRFEIPAWQEMKDLASEFGKLEVSGELKQVPYVIQKPEITGVLPLREYFSFAYALQMEPEYESANSDLAIGFLTMAQFAIYETDRPLAVDLRDIRHYLQNGKNQEAIKASREFAAKIRKG